MILLSGNDIALLELAEEVDISDSHYTPVCLPTPRESFVGKTATATGKLNLSSWLPAYHTHIIQRMVLDSKNCKSKYDIDIPHSSQAKLTSSLIGVT